MKRVIVYIDGFNLYHGMREKHWKRYYWLNLLKVAQSFLKPHQKLIVTKYFTSKVSSPPAKQRRQNAYLEALGTLPDFCIYYGHFLEDKHSCFKCGHTYPTHHEKMTDVNIAVELLADAFQDRFDVALVVSGDSDLVGPVKKVKELFARKFVIAVFPPARYSTALVNTAHAVLHISRNTLAKSQFSDEVTKPDGYVLKRPEQWQ